MSAQKIEAKLIITRRTIALELKAISDLETRIARKRKVITALQKDETKLAGQLSKALAK